MAGVAQYDDDANSNKVQIEKEAKKPVSATNLNNQTNKTI
jgi:hypothetical protein